MESDHLQAKGIDKYIYVYIFLLLCWPKYASLPGPIHISPFNIITIFALGYSAFKIFMKLASGFFSQWSSALIFIYVLEWAARSASDLMGTSPSEAVYNTVRDYAWVGSPFAILVAADRIKFNLDRIAKLILVLAMFIALTTAFEYMTQISMANIIFKIFPLDSSSAYASMLLGDKSRDGAFRAQSFFTHPLVLGGVLSAFAAVAFSGIKQEKRGWRLISALTFILCVAAIPMTGTRSALVSVLVAIFANLTLNVLAIRRRDFRTVAIIVSFSIFLFGAFEIMSFANELKAGSTAAQAQSSTYREDMWAKGAPAIAMSPVFGFGDGQSLRIAGVKVGDGLTVDDFYLTQLLDFGFLHELVAVIFFVFLTVSQFSKQSIINNRNYAIGMISGMVGILVSQKATSIAESTEVFYLFAGILAGVLSPPSVVAGGAEVKLDDNGSTRP
ncbi:MAG: O-antigen ligase family protein [Formivibrio sp.]|nr:O-antigen ligase family protein [Formivibrio sp.]